MGQGKSHGKVYLDLREVPCETFSGPETMDLEHDRLGFLGIFSKSADFSKL